MASGLASSWRHRCLDRHTDAAYGPTMHVVHGLRQAVIMLLVGVALALAAAGVWYAVQGGDARTRIAVSLMVTAGLLSVTGGTLVTRLMTNDARALLGAGPDREDPYTGEGLGAVGVFLFVALPMFVVGLALLG